MLVGHVPFSGDSATMVMMKHLQEPVPSILDERKDVPPAVGRVVSRAMAKLPGNRYQNVAELIEDLMIAGGMIGATATTKSTNLSAPPGQAAAADLDETTVVRPRVEPVSSHRRAPVTVPVSAPPQQVAPIGNFNPVKILIPSAAALLVLFAVIYAFTRNSGTGTNINYNQPQILAADPNSQPVQPAQPPTGKAEEGIPAGGGINASAKDNTNKNLNINAEVAPTPLGDISPSVNVNENANATPSTNSNRKAPPVPEPSRSVSPENAPAPSPSCTTPTAKPSPATPVSSRPADEVQRTQTGIWFLL